MMRNKPPILTLMNMYELFNETCTSNTFSKPKESILEISLQAHVMHL